VTSPGGASLLLLALSMSDCGFTTEQIADSLTKFDEDTMDERKKFGSLGEFNEAILKAKGDVPLAKICKGLFVGNILLKNAIKQNHPYMVASCEEFVILVPFGPIQSIIHLMAIPKVPMYNAVTVDSDGVVLLRKMKAALQKVIIDILTPGSEPQKIFLEILRTAIDVKPTETSSIRITQESRELDTHKMTGAEAIELLRDILNKFYEEKTKSGFPLEQAVCTDLHIHDTHTVGQLHLHGWVAETELITDNGVKLKFKNTPMDRFIPVLSKHRGLEFSESNVVVEVKSSE